MRASSFAYASPPPFKDFMNLGHILASENPGASAAALRLFLRRIARDPAIIQLVALGKGRHRYRNALLVIRCPICHRIDQINYISYLSRFGKWRKRTNRRYSRGLVKGMENSGKRWGSCNSCGRLIGMYGWSREQVTALYKKYNYDHKMLLHALRIIYHGAKQRAKKYGRKFDSQLILSIPAPPKYCPREECHARLTAKGRVGRDPKKRRWSAASLNRIDANKGYTPENCEWICLACNTREGADTPTRTIEAAMRMLQQGRVGKRQLNKLAQLVTQ